MWRLVLRRVATWEEITRYWDLDEVMRANEFLDLQDDAEYQAHKMAELKSRNARR
jgi:hypothetical protein